MSDFLSHLAARSLTPSGNLRPRVPALYEPIREYEGLLAGRQETPQPAPQERSVAEESLIPRAATPSPAATFASSRDALQEHARRGTAGVKTALVDAPHAELAEDPLSSASASHVTHAAIFLPGDVRPATEPASRSSHVARRSAASAMPVVSETAAAPAFLQSSRPLSADDAALLAGRETALLGEGPAGISRAPNSPSSITPAAAAARAGTAQAPAASPEPAIQVSIGRVEVRAVFPPQPAARREPAPRSRPTLSLDDYLKRGSGAGR